MTTAVDQHVETTADDDMDFCAVERNHSELDDEIVPNLAEMVVHKGTSRHNMAAT